MLEVIFTFCLLADPKVCREVNFGPVEVTGNPAFACQHSTVSAYEWMQSHPGYRVTKWTCGRPTAKS